MNSELAKFSKLALLGLLASLTLMACDQKKDEAVASTPSVSGDDKPVLSGEYKSSCEAIGGMTIGGATHKYNFLHFGVGGVANKFANTVYFTSDSSCLTNVYAGFQEGNFSVGAESDPPGAWVITFTGTATHVGVMTNGARTDLNTGCGMTFSAPPDLATIGTDFNCANLSILANATLYNVFKEEGNILSFGTATGDNVGVPNPNGISGSLFFTFTK